jgi:hypothetical protein
MNVTLPLSLQNKLLTVPELTLEFHRTSVYNAFLDTGSGGTLFDTDMVAAIGISYDTGMDIRTIQGIGEPETVFEHEINIEVATLRLDGFIAEIGNMQQYGFTALIGLDFLLATHAIIDLDAMTLTLRT